jgi:hypothetical protein
MTETITLTRARFEELIRIERTCGDFVSMMLDLNQPQNPSKPALAGIDASSRYVAGLVRVSLSEAALALSIPFDLSA